MAGENRVKLIQQADKLYKAGKLEVALKEYQRVLDMKPDDLEIRKIIGELKLRLNKIGEAVTHFEWIADYYLKEGFYPKATAMYKRITRIDPQNESISFKLADLYSKQGLIIEAKQIYLELVEEYKRQNNQKKALNIYKKILEFDRGNPKMHLLLAENYLRENMVEEALSEYVATSEILIRKKEFKQAQDVLQDVLKKTRNLKILDMLISCYLSEGNEDQAIQTLVNIGEEIVKHPPLLKKLGDLYLKRNQVDKAEKIYRKLVEVDSSQIEMIMNLGKLYLQRDEFDKCYQLFLPVIEQFGEKKKYDEATSMLRFIITSNNTYLPALLKLASIFKISSKTSSLIAIYEALIPIYEQKGMIDELKDVLKELIQVSDSPYNYQEMLQRFSQDRAAVKKEDSDKEAEFISFQINNANQALRQNDFRKANDLLQTAKSAFPRNIEIRTKIFDLYQMTGNIEELINEGVELLQLYKDVNREDDYNDLYEKLSRLRPNDERLLYLGGNEKTNIEIDFDHHELIEQMSELNYSAMGEMEMMEEKKPFEEEVFLLEGEDSVSFKNTQSEKEFSKGLSSHLVELDFYISEGYFDNADKILERLKIDYPESREVISRLERIQKIKEQKGIKKEKVTIPVPPKMAEEPQLLINDSIVEESGVLQEFEDSQYGIDEFLLKSDDQGLVVEEPVEEPLSIFEGGIQVEERDESGVSVQPLEEVEEIPAIAEIQPLETGDEEELKFDLDLDRPESEEVEFLTLDEEEKEEKFIPSPPVSPAVKENTDAGRSKSKSGSADLLDLDNILTFEEEAPAVLESPFKEIDDLVFPVEEELLKEEEEIFLEEEHYYQIEQQVSEELQAIRHWEAEMDKQRTSTMEKNMMEIFKEFKRGVDEKIGNEDFETRYNLGIAYKEMGLLEEAIHEFLISSKHPVKLFDSAGMLGICFRDKGMLDESVNWFEKALKATDRHADETKAIKYELLLSVKLKEDFGYARQLAKEISQTDPDYRNISQLLDEIKGK